MSQKEKEILADALLELYGKTQAFQNFLREKFKMLVEEGYVHYFDDELDKVRLAAREELEKARLAKSSAEFYATLKPLETSLGMCLDPISLEWEAKNREKKEPDNGKI